MNTTLKGLIKSFTKSVDLYNYLLKNHHRRTAIAAYKIGRQLNLSESQISDLVIAAALHDIGALTVSERDALVQMDIDDPYPHSKMGCYMLESFKPFRNISKIVYYHHWPYNEDMHWVEEKGEVPIESYIIHVADRVEILTRSDSSIINQKEKIIEKIKEYKNSLFKPEVVDAFETVADQDTFWLDIENFDMNTILEKAISKNLEIEMTMDLLEQFAFTLSKIIDSRSKFTISHSFGVGSVAYELADLLGYSEQQKRYIRVAGLLHDIGKIAVPSELIEKKGPLDEQERSEVQAHAYFSYLILNEMDGFEDIAFWASNHHENHDGSGYPNSLSEEFFTEEMDIIAYADIFTALSENRPYRTGLSKEEILYILSSGFSNKHGQYLLNIIENNIDKIENTCKEAIRDGEIRYNTFEDASEVHLVAN